MKKLIPFFVILFSIACSPQERVTPATLQKCDDINQVKDALVNYVIYTGDLERQNAQLNQTVQVAQNFINEIRLVKTIAERDSVCKKYGIPVEVKSGKRNGR